MVANGHDLATEKKEKSSKIRRKRSKSQSKRKSSRKESSNDKSDDAHTNGDKIHVEIKDNWNSREYHDQDDTPDTYDDMDELKGGEGAPKAPSRHKSSKKGKKSSKKDKPDDGDVEENMRVSGRSLKSTRSRGAKEDKKPSVPRRDRSVGKPSSNRSLSKKSRHGDEDASDRQTKKSGRRSRRVSPDSRTDDDDDLEGASLHSVKKDSDKSDRRSRSSTSKKRTPTSSRKKAPAGAKLPRRKLKEKSSHHSDDTHVSVETETSDDMDEDVTQEISLNDEDAAPESARTRRERRKDRSSNGDARKMKTSSTHGSRSSRSTLSSRRDGMRKSHSERWDRAGEAAEGEEAKNSPVVKRRSKASDGMSKSAHTSRVKRNNSSGLSRMKGSLNNRSYHGSERDHRSASGGKRTPKRLSRRNGGETPNSTGDESIKSFDTHSFHDGRSQATLESVEDYEDFEEDVYAMEMQTPGMVDFDQEMLDLMQRANPEVTDHLDRRVHRKREMVAFDQNMPMMTRQALLTRQASSQVQRQFIDGSTIDKKRLLLRNDSMGSSSHRSTMRSALAGRRAPPRAMSSGLGAMGRGGFMDANREGDDRRHMFRSGSSQAASFNQYYQNKPNRVRNLSRRASGDLAPVHGRPRTGEVRRKPVQRAASTTAIRRANSADHMAPVKPLRRMSNDKIEEDMDMSTKRNRSKLHFMMFKSKMNVDMEDLFKQVREGETPRSPIDSLRMPSP